MDFATRYTLRRNTASIMKIWFLFFCPKRVSNYNLQITKFSILERNLRLPLWRMRSTGLLQKKMQTKKLNSFSEELNSNGTVLQAWTCLMVLHVAIYHFFFQFFLTFFFGLVELVYFTSHTLLQVAAMWWEAKSRINYCDLIKAIADLLVSLVLKDIGSGGLWFHSRDN